MIQPVAPGSYASGVIILLSDGRRTAGPDPIEVAKMAAERGVRVYTVGFGTIEGTTISMDNYSFYVRLDEETLKSGRENDRRRIFSRWHRRRFAQGVRKPEHQAFDGAQGNRNQRVLQRASRRCSR